MPKGYWIVRVDVADLEKYKAYMDANYSPLRKYGKAPNPGTRGPDGPGTAPAAYLDPRRFSIILAEPGRRCGGPNKEWR